MQTSCENFLGAKDKDGYGYQRGLGERKAHRVAYVKAHGPIPNGLHVLHKCDNPSCVNPDHLFLGTPKDNMEDKHRKGRQKYPGCSLPGEKNPKARLTLDQVKYIRATYQWGMGPKLAKMFGVGVIQINRIVRGEAWNETT